MELSRLSNLPNVRNNWSGPRWGYWNDGAVSPMRHWATMGPWGWHNNRWRCISNWRSNSWVSDWAADHVWWFGKCDGEDASKSELKEKTTTTKLILKCLSIWYYKILERQTKSRLQWFWTFWSMFCLLFSTRFVWQLIWLWFKQQDSVPYILICLNSGPMTIDHLYHRLMSAYRFTSFT